MAKRELTENEKLLRNIEAFVKKHDMRETTFSRAATGNPSFISNLRRAHFGLLPGPSMRTVNRIKNFMKTYKGTKL